VVWSYDVAALPSTSRTFLPKAVEYIKLLHKSEAGVQHSVVDDGIASFRSLSYPEFTPGPSPAPEYSETAVFSSAVS